VKLTAHIKLALPLRMRGAIPLHPQYAFMEWWSVKKSTGTNSLTLIAVIYFLANAFPLFKRRRTSNGKILRNFKVLK
jgi:hypothetical protein